MLAMHVIGRGKIASSKKTGRIVNLAKICRVGRLYGSSGYGGGLLFNQLPKHSDRCVKLALGCLSGGRVHQFHLPLGDRTRVCAL